MWLNAPKIIIKIVAEKEESGGGSVLQHKLCGLGSVHSGEMMSRRTKLGLA